MGESHNVYLITVFFGFRTHRDMLMSVTFA